MVVAGVSLLGWSVGSEREVWRRGLAVCVRVADSVSGWWVVLADSVSAFALWADSVSGPWSWKADSVSSHFVKADSVSGAEVG